MILIYAYIRKFKNYVEQEIIFDHTYKVSFQDGKLAIGYCGEDVVKAALRAGQKPDNVHLVVGKTGSGKTNLLQLIGMKYDVRHHRKWVGEDDSYFLLYKVSDTEFFMELCDVEIEQFPVGARYQDETMPERIRANAERTRSLRTVRFGVKKSPVPGEMVTQFERITEYGYKESLTKEKARDMAFVINCYDKHAFIKPPYPEEKENGLDSRDSWLGRLVYPYDRTSLWRVCDYIREYLIRMEPGDAKRQTSLVLSARNFSDQYPIQLPSGLETEYWTFAGWKRDELMAEYDEEARARLAKRKKRRDLSNKQMFIHDLWTDYAIYLRKWVERIHSYQEEIPKENLDSTGMFDVYQEFIDYYAGKEYKDGIDPTILPDGMQMSIVKRCIWLAQYIDRAGGGDPHGLLWQIMDDLKDIGKYLDRLDDRYFTIDTCTIPVMDMEKKRYKQLFENMFDCMEQYIPDDAGIFTRELLPYSFTHLSTGEYQYAKVLGGLEEYLNISFSNGSRKYMDTIILLDEPEAYMHPELARQFVRKLYEIMRQYHDERTIQVIIGTHSPFMVSDVLASDITRLDIDRQSGNAVVNNGSQKAYFGANIHTILADGFFLDYSIGEFSRQYLQDAYMRLNGYLEKIEKEGNGNILTEAEQNDVHVMKLLTPQIGDRLIQRVFEIALEQL